LFFRRLQLHHPLVAAVADLARPTRKRRRLRVERRRKKMPSKF